MYNLKEFKAVSPAFKIGFSTFCMVHSYIQCPGTNVKQKYLKALKENL